MILYGEAERTQDDYGRWIITHTEKTAYCQYTRVSMTEFYNAGRNGFTPEYRFKVFAGDYNGETKVGFRGLTYSVYRTYQPEGSDLVELYVKREGGTNGESDAGQSANGD